MAIRTRQELLDYWNSKIIQNSNQAITGQIMNVGGIDIIESMAMGTEATGKMDWKGEWVVGEYNTDDVVRDGEWTMVANKTTQDRPAPQTIGNPAYLYQTDNLSSGPIVANQIIAGQRYTPTSPKLITGMRLYTTATQIYTIYLIRNSTTTPEFIQVGSSFTAGITGWERLNTPNFIIPANTSYDLIAVVEPNTAPVTTNANYDYTTPNNPAIPALGGIVHANSALDELWISRTDSDTTGRGALLDSLKAGDHIIAGGQNWTVQVNTPFATYNIIEVLPAVQLPLDTNYQFSFQVYTAVSITDWSDATEWTGDPTVLGLHGVDIPWEDIVPADGPQYICDVELQDMTVSPDWDLLAFSGESNTWEPDYTFTKILNHTVTTQYPTFDPVGSLPVQIPAGLNTYEIKFSWTYTLNSTVNSAHFRFSIDNGANWDEFQEEPKDITDNRPRYYAFPRQYNQENPSGTNILFEAAKGNVGDVMVVTFLDIIFQLVK